MTTIDFQTFKLIFSLVYVSGGNNPNDCIIRMNNASHLARMMWTIMKEQESHNENFFQSNNHQMKVFRACKKKPITVHACEMDENFEVQTPEGLMKGEKGDFLMRGVKGELYPIKREVFFETYDWEDEGQVLESGEF